MREICKIKILKIKLNKNKLETARKIKKQNKNIKKQNKTKEEK